MTPERSPAPEPHFDLTGASIVAFFVAAFAIAAVVVPACLRINGGM